MHQIEMTVIWLYAIKKVIYIANLKTYAIQSLLLKIDEDDIRRDDNTRRTIVLQ